MTSKSDNISAIDAQTVKRVVQTAENALKVSWSRLLMIQRADTSANDRYQAFISFQPNLFSTLFDLESLYNNICDFDRYCKSKIIPSKQGRPAPQNEVLERYKIIINQVIDVGRALGDAFAWIFYQSHGKLLKKHFEHEFVSRITPRLGGKGEVQFICNHQMFGRYFVLSHAITTILREGDVSLVDPTSLRIAAIGELKTRKLSDTEASTFIFFPGENALRPDMLPVLPKKSSPNSVSHSTLEPKFLQRLDKQIKRIEKIFSESTPTIKQEGLRAAAASSSRLRVEARTSTA